MSDRIDDDPALSELDDQRGLWRQLGDAARVDPGPRLRHQVLHDLHQHTRARLPWWRALLPAQPAQWAGVAAAAVLGLCSGLLLNGSEARVDQRLAQLETQLEGMNHQLLMSRLTAAAPGERLAAALQAAMLEQRDPDIAAALLQRAAIDNVPSVRSAAIGALGAEINQRDTARQLLDVLASSDSPIVQMAIIDLILRHGDDDLLKTLKDRANQQTLHPALAGYVQDTMGALEI
jgi:hypothetical protein